MRTGRVGNGYGGGWALRPPFIVEPGETPDLLRVKELREWLKEQGLEKPDDTVEAFRKKNEELNRELWERKRANEALHAKIAKLEDGLKQIAEPGPNVLRNVREIARRALDNGG